LDGRGEERKRQDDDRDLDGVVPKPLPAGADDGEHDGGFREEREPDDPVQDVADGAQRFGRWRVLEDRHRDGEDGGGASEGRNDKLTRFVGHLLRRYVDPELVLELAYLVNDHRFRPPLEHGEVDRLVDSVAGAELRRRNRAVAS
jgi:Primase C terminal 1 (PriCT-1)